MPETGRSKEDVHVQREHTSSAESSSRGVVIAIGHTFQVFGVVFSLGACLFWALSAWLLEPADRAVTRLSEYFSDERLSATAITVGVVTTLVGGMGLCAAGLGLQGERPTSGRVAKAVTGPMAVIYSAVALVLLARTGSWIAGITAVVFALASIVLVALAAHAAEVLRQFPPTSDQQVIDHDLLDKLHRKHGSGAPDP